jgi:DNA-binding transcriptional MerR regulator
VSAYTLGDAARICRISPERLRYWERTRLFGTSARVDSRPAFGFQDLVSLRSLKRLLDDGVSLRRIRRSMEAVRRKLPEVDHPLPAIQVWAKGSRRLVLRHEGVLMEPSGQTVLDFDASQTADDGIAQLIAPSAPASLTPLTFDSNGPGLDPASWFERGCRLDTDRSTWGSAIEAYLEALEIDPEYADAWCNLGAVYFNQNRRGRAREAFERAVASDSSHLEANLNLASMLEEEGADEAALRYYRVALESEPLHSDTHVSLALLYQKLGLRRRARDHWRRYLALDPQGAWGDLARKRLDPENGEH